MYHYLSYTTQMKALFRCFFITVLRLITGAYVPNNIPKITTAFFELVM